MPMFEFHGSSATYARLSVSTSETNAYFCLLVKSLLHRLLVIAYSSTLYWGGDWGFACLTPVSLVLDQAATPAQYCLASLLGKRQDQVHFNLPPPFPI